MRCAVACTELAHRRTRRRKTIPPDQERAYERTKGAMHKVAAAFASNAADVTIEVLRVATDVAELAPVAGLAEAARILLSIWDGVQFVEVCPCTRPPPPSPPLTRADKPHVVSASHRALCDDTVQRASGNQRRRPGRD